MLGIIFNDWVAIFFGVVWDFEKVVTNIPMHVWMSIILAVGVTLLDRNYPKSVSPSEYSKMSTPCVKVENVDSNTEGSSKA